MGDPDGSLAEFGDGLVDLGLAAADENDFGSCRSKAARDAKAQSGCPAGNQRGFPGQRKISVHIYDSEGNLAEVEVLRKQHFAAVRVAPKRTGSYYLIVEIEKSDHERTSWALAYGFR